MFNFPILITLYAGFTHAFETDHVLAVSNLVTNRKRLMKAMLDGAFWGLGHTSTILFTGLLVLFLKFKLQENTFHYFEAFVGIMLICLGIFRLIKWYKKQRPSLHTHVHTHTDGQVHVHTHLHTLNRKGHEHSHLPAYSVGLVHGLAGSGSLLLAVMIQMKTAISGLTYLLLFGLGSVGGMILVAGLFSMPFSQKIFRSQTLQMILVLLSASLCVGYGSWVVYKNLLA